MQNSGIRQLVRKRRLLRRALDTYAGYDNANGDTDEEDEYEELGRIRLSITRGQAIAFCEHADAAVSAGRPPCHWCDGVVDPDGHVCPRMN